MPKYNEIATALIRAPSASSARVPLDARAGDSLIYPDGFRGVVFLDGNDQPISRSVDFWTTLKDHSQYAYFVFPITFYDGPELFHVRDDLDAIGALGSTLQFEIPAGLSNGAALTFTVQFSGGIYWPRDNPPFWSWDMGGFADNHGDDSGRDAFGKPIENVGKRMTVRKTVGGKWVEFLPARSERIAQPIWMRRITSGSDFQNLVLDVSGSVESLARRSLQIETDYLPILEDLDTQISYGHDANGIPINWLLQGIERTDRSVILNLTADIV